MERSGAWVWATAAFVASAWATPARAQVVVGPPIRIDITGPGPANEPTLAANRFDPSELVAGFNDYRLGGSMIASAVSVDGGMTWTDAILPLPPEHSAFGAAADPMSAFDPRTGMSWLGGLSFDAASEGSGLFVARKPMGTTSFEPAIAALTMIEPRITVDKPLLAAGRDPFDATRTNVYILYTRFERAVGYLSCVRSTDLGLTWEPPVDTLQVGQGAAPAVLGTGAIVFAYRSTVLSSILTARSVDGGLSWIGPTTVAAVDLAQNADVPGTFRTSTLPGIAVDRRTNDIYVSYQARVAPGSTDIDAYVARSRDGGETFPEVECIPAPPGTDQFFPWIVVDARGGVNVLWYDTRNVAQADNATNAWLDAYYARITGFGSAEQAIEEHRLTPASFFTATNFNGTFIGDYHQLGAEGRFVDLAYMSTHEGAQHVYAHRLELPGCPADFNADGLLNIFDLLAFQSSFGDEQPEADIAPPLGSFDVFDFLAFQTLFTEGC